MKRFLFVTVVCLVFVCLPLLQAAEKAELQDLKLATMKAELVKEGHTFTIDNNEAMQYSISQLCSLNPDLAGPEDMMYENNEADLSTTQALPSYYMGYYTPIKNQGSCGSCWAFAICGVMESHWKKLFGTNYDTSEQFQLDCNTYGYSCNGGWFTSHNNHKSAYWAKYESCYPYVAYKKTCTASSSCNFDYISSWYYVGTSTGVPTASSIKQKIYDKGAVAAAVYVDSYFQAYTSGTFTRNASGNVNHAILLVGWDDSKAAWRLKNSWGTGWGESGLMWIAYTSQKVGYAANYVNY
jgi:C1A family cysteine protease